MINRLRGGKKEQQRQNFELKIKRPEINPTVAHLASGQFYWQSIPLILQDDEFRIKELQLFRFYGKHGRDSQPPAFVRQVSLIEFKTKNGQSINDLSSSVDAQDEVDSSMCDE